MVPNESTHDEHVAESAARSELERISSMDVMRELVGFGRNATRRVVAVAPPDDRASIVRTR